MYYFINILLCLFLLSGCATSTNVVDTDSSASISHDNHSRSLYLFSMARFSSLEGNYPAALSLLREAINLDPSSAFLHSAVAEIKLKIGQVQEALEYINKAVKLDPTYRDPYVMGGILMATAGKDLEAVQFLRMAVKLDPAKEDAYLHMAASLTRLFEYEEAVTILKTLIKNNNESVLGYYYLGRTYSQMKLYRDAVTFYTKALELRPEFEQASIDMATSYEALGDYSQAIVVYQRLLEGDELKPAVLQRLIQLLIQQRRFDEALEQLNLAADSGLGGQDTMRKIGLIHLELDQYDEAIIVFNDILIKDETAHHIRLYLGIAYEEKGDLVKALSEFKKIPHDIPAYVEAVGHVAFILKEQGQVDAAVKSLKDAIAVDPSKIDFYLNLSVLYESLGQTDVALQLLNDSEMRFKNESKLYFRIAVLFDKLGKKSESIESMKKVLVLNPKDPQALNFIGYSYAELGINLDEALNYVKQASELRPNDGFIMDSLAWVYFKMRNYDEAIRLLEEAIKLVEDDSTILEHLGDAYLAKLEHKKALKTYKKALEIDPTRKELLDKVRMFKGEQGER